MTHLHAQLQQRSDEAAASLRDALLTGDHYLAEVRIGELQELARIAADHDLRLLGIEDLLAGCAAA